jgi:hypothetical protein
MEIELADILLGRVTGESGFAKNTGAHEHPRREEVARLAYEFYARRGRADGSDVDDWLRAERDLRRHFADA